MGVRLVTEVLRHAPAELSHGERLVLVVLALYARDDTRQCWPGADVVCHMCGMSAVGVRKALERLAARGYEVRQPIGRHRAGRPLFAARGHRTVYRLPEFPPREQPGKAIPRYHLSEEKGDTAGPERRYGSTTKAIPPYPPNSQEASGTVSSTRAREKSDDTAAIALLAQRPDVRNAARLWTTLTDEERDEWRAKAATVAAERERLERDDTLRRAGRPCHRCAVRYLGDICPQCHTPREDVA